MIVIGTFQTRLDADLARIALEAADIPAVVIGVGVGMEGGALGVRLMVPDDRVEEARKVLHDVQEAPSSTLAEGSPWLDGNAP